MKVTTVLIIRSQIMNKDHSNSILKSPIWKKTKMIAA